MFGVDNRVRETPRCGVSDRMSALHGLVLKRIPRFIPEPRNIFCTVPLSKRPKIVKKILNTDNKNSYT